MGTKLPSSSTSLASPWATTRLDPNGYYAILGLTRGGEFPGEVEKAYKQSLLRYHPDTGDEPSTQLLLRVQQAWTVLSDVDTRREYDALGEGEEWIDDPEVQARLYREARIAAVEVGMDPDTAVELVADRIGVQVKNKFNAKQVTRSRSSVWDEETMRQLASWEDRPKTPEEWDEFLNRDIGPELVYYFYPDTVTKPISKRTVARWVSLLAQASHAFGLEDGPLHLCFDRGVPRIEDTGWALLFVVPAGWKPTRGVASILAAKKKVKTQERGHLR